MKINFGATRGGFLIYRNITYRYNYQQHICIKDIRHKFLDDKELYYYATDNGFNLFKRLEGNKFVYIPASWDNYLNTDKEDRDFFYKHIMASEISSFYQLDIEIEIKGKRITNYYQIPNHYEEIRFQYSAKEHNTDIQHLEEIFGQQVTNAYEGRGTEYLQPIKSIDKIIGVKRYKECVWLGTDQEDNFNGETEEIVLDMRNFNEETYRFFKDHDILEIEW